MLSEIEKLEHAIASLEAQRSILGDAVVDTALSPLREKLSTLKQASAGPVVDDETQQRKIITVLFADVPGFATQTEHMDTEDVRDAVNGLWEKLDAEILRFGGRIDKHMGHGVMALWGADVVGEDDPERAIRAALAMRTALETFSRQTGFFSRPGSDPSQLGLRVGINTGPAIVGLVGTTDEFTAIGDTVNLAARLSQSAQVGEIIVAQDTLAQVRGIFDVQVLSPMTIKGKSELVQAYLIEKAKPRAFYIRSRGVEGIETSMVGRDTELRHLQHAFDDLFEHPRPRMVTVVGDMGLGKSRLLYEFLAWADLRPMDWWLFQGRSLPSQTGSPYAMLRDLFVFRFQIQDNDSLAVVHEKMEQGFREFMPDDPNPVEKAHIVGQLIGFDFSSSPYLRGIIQDPRQIRSLGFSYITRFFIAAAKTCPVVLLLEDLHWTDSGSLDAGRHIMSNLPAETPFLVLAMTRPALFERFPGASTDFVGNETITLKPLTRDESRGLVEQILMRVSLLPAALRELVVGGADGNPFYLEELIKMLIDGRVIHTDSEETWTIDLEKLGTVNIPSTLSGVLQARLDRLNALERASLQRASVVGRIFWDSAVEALSPERQVEHEHLQEALSLLRSKELIYPSPVSTFSGTQEFAFKHAMLRDVAYETVLKRQRVQYHALVADWLSTVSGERRGEFLPIIADHYEKAGDVNKAADTLLEAGDQALSVSGFTEAFRFYQRVGVLLPETRHRDHISLQLKLGEVFLRSGELQDALRYSEKALELARGLSRTNLYAFSLYQTGQVYAEMGNYQQAEKLLNEALPLARTGGREAQNILARVLFGLGNLYWRLGRLDEALSFCMESQQLADEHGDSNTMLLALNRLGVVKGLLGDAAGEADAYHRVLELSISLGNRERAAVALNNLGAFADEHGELEKAQGYYLRAIEMAREIGAQQSLALYLINLAHSEIRLRDLDFGRRHLQEGLALASHLGATPWALMAVVFFARLEYASDNLERALHLLGMAEHHPAYSLDHQRLTEQMLAEWQLDDRYIIQQMAIGSALDWDETLKALSH